MAKNYLYITAGLPVAKNAGQTPTSGKNTVYITAGLPPVVLTAAGGFKPYWIPRTNRRIGAFA